MHDPTIENLTGDARTDFAVARAYEALRKRNPYAAEAIRACRLMNASAQLSWEQEGKPTKGPLVDILMDQAAIMASLAERMEHLHALEEAAKAEAEGEGQ